MNLLGIILSKTDLWLLGALSVCLAWLVPHRLNYWREKEARRIAACQRFRSALLTELSGLYPTPIEWPSEETIIIDILKAKFPALEAAVFEFCHTLPLYKKFFFLRAWRTYRLGKEGREIDHQCYWQYVPSHGEGNENGKHIKHDNRFIYKTNFKSNIDRLLSYA